MTCAEAVSLAHHLEPIAGAALAINLAFLALDRFRHLGQIRKHARAEVQRLDDGETVLHEMPDCRVVQRLAGLRGLVSAELPVGADDPHPPPPPPSNSAGMRFGLVGAYFLEFHLDRIVSVISAAAAAGVLTVGVAHNVGLWHGLKCYFDADSIACWFVVGVFAMSWPVVSVMIGRAVRRWAKAFSTKAVNDISNYKRRLLLKPVEAAAEVPPPASKPRKQAQRARLARAADDTQQPTSN